MATKKRRVGRPVHVVSTVEAAEEAEYEEGLVNLGGRDGADGKAMMEDDSLPKKAKKDSNSNGKSGRGFCFRRRVSLHDIGKSILEEDYVDEVLASSSRWKNRELVLHVIRLFKELEVSDTEHRNHMLSLIQICQTNQINKTNSKTNPPQTSNNNVTKTVSTSASSSSTTSEGLFGAFSERTENRRRLRFSVLVLDDVLGNMDVKQASGLVKEWKTLVNRI